MKKSNKKSNEPNMLSMVSDAKKLAEKIFSFTVKQKPDWQIAIIAFEILYKNLKDSLGKKHNVEIIECFGEPQETIPNADTAVELYPGVTLTAPDKDPNSELDSGHLYVSEMLRIFKFQKEVQEELNKIKDKKLPKTEANLQLMQSSEDIRLKILEQHTKIAEELKKEHNLLSEAKKIFETMGPLAI